MARFSSWAMAAFILLLSSSLIHLSSSAEVHPISSDLRRTVVLPLSLSSRHTDGYRHGRRLFHGRELSGKPTARMRLYDNLLSNGYYTTRLLIGTPPQEFALIVDTGSTVTYVPCSSCKQCGKHQDPRFQPELSSTYQPVKCDSQCYCDSEGKQCTYERRYAEMSSSSGVLGNDMVSFGNESELLPHRVVFGCENKETGDLYKQRADGIMGLGRGSLSVMNQLVEKGAVGDSFSLCYGGMDVGGGAMILGSIAPPPGMVFSHSDSHRSPYYNFEMKEIHVAGKPLKLSASTFNGGHGTVLDSGTTYAYFPSRAFVALKDAIIKSITSLRQIPGPDPNYHDICFAGAGWNVSHLQQVFPEVDMVFSNGGKLSLSPENYLFRHTKVLGAYCLGIFKSENDETTLLGGIIVRNTLVTYDRENKKIGFWKTNCSELWKTLQEADSSTPADLVPRRHNTSLVMPPVEAPSGLPAINFSRNVVLITFEMSFYLKDTSTMLNFTEFADLISHELEINASQVQLLNFTQKGNYFFLTCAISPAKFKKNIPDSMVMSIILRLRDHKVQFPQRFGSYKLVKWSTQIAKKQTWWHQHLLAVVISATIVVFLSLLSFGIWFAWRKKRLPEVVYQPVDADATFPEQELQPL
ncbi:hypothetical protein SAY87_031508 [Trapa incisa]|uniref:Peptidase A1 domain-containing protein n=1 Tax=Trapa incisa TaxID=236973 RepID=A0AAN7KXA7_9MYRT|nr:hypothetical protein SAY87_031508 [Trapa incisa]